MATITIPRCHQDYEGQKPYVKDFKEPLTAATLAERLFWCEAWNAYLFWVLAFLWNVFAIFIGIANTVCASGCGNQGNPHGLDPAWNSPFMHLMYFTPGYWLAPGIAHLGPLFTWFLGG